MTSVRVQMPAISATQDHQNNAGAVHQCTLLLLESCLFVGCISCPARARNVKHPGQGVNSVWYMAEFGGDTSQGGSKFAHATAARGAQIAAKSRVCAL